MSLDMASQSLAAIGVLVLGGVVVLLLAGMIGTHAWRAALLGVPFTVVAAILGVQGPAARFGRKRREAAIAPLRSRAADISAALGYNQPDST